MAVVAYLRCSPRGSDREGSERTGLQAQRAEVVGWCRARGQVLRAVHEEVASSVASLENRPALVLALSELESGDILLVAERSRLGRSVPLLMALDQAAQKRGASVEAVRAVEGTGPEAKLSRRIQDAIAEYELELVRLRTRLAVQARRAAGLAVGHAPLGYRVGSGGRLVEDEDEQRAARLCRYWRSRWRWSYRRCARELERRGVPSRSGRWHPETVRRLLGGSDGR